MDVISAAMLTQARHPILAPIPFPPFFNPGSNMIAIFSKMEPVGHLQRHPETLSRQDLKFVVNYKVQQTATTFADREETLDYKDVSSLQAVLGEDRTRVYLFHDFADSPLTGQMYALRRAFERLNAGPNDKLKYVITTVDWSQFCVPSRNSKQRYKIMASMR